MGVVSREGELSRVKKGQNLRWRVIKVKERRCKME